MYWVVLACAVDGRPTRNPLRSAPAAFTVVQLTAPEVQCSASDTSTGVSEAGQHDRRPEQRPPNHALKRPDGGAALGDSARPPCRAEARRLTTHQTMADESLTTENRYNKYHSTCDGEME